MGTGLSHVGTGLSPAWGQGSLIRKNRSSGVFLARLVRGDRARCPLIPGACVRACVRVRACVCDVE
jgi:hypothetical protein